MLCRKSHVLCDSVDDKVCFISLSRKCCAEHTTHLGSEPFYDKYPLPKMGSQLEPRRCKAATFFLGKLVRMHVLRHVQLYLSNMEYPDICPYLGFANELICTHILINHSLPPSHPPTCDTDMPKSLDRSGGPVEDGRGFHPSQGKSFLDESSVIPRYWRTNATVDLAVDSVLTRGTVGSVEHSGNMALLRV